MRSKKEPTDVTLANNQFAILASHEDTDDDTMKMCDEVTTVVPEHKTSKDIEAKHHNLNKDEEAEANVVLKQVENTGKVMIPIPAKDKTMQNETASSKKPVEQWKKKNDEQK